MFGLKHGCRGFEIAIELCSTDRAAALESPLPPGDGGGYFATGMTGRYCVVERKPKRMLSDWMRMKMEGLKCNRALQ